jgi:hypothetical protein
MSSGPLKKRRQADSARRNALDARVRFERLCQVGMHVEGRRLGGLRARLHIGVSHDGRHFADLERWRMESLKVFHSQIGDRGVAAKEGKIVGVTSRGTVIWMRPTEGPAGVYFIGHDRMRFLAPLSYCTRAIPTPYGGVAVEEERVPESLIVRDHPRVVRYVMREGVQTFANHQQVRLLGDGSLLSVQSEDDHGIPLIPYLLHQRFSRDEAGADDAVRADRVSVCVLPMDPDVLSAQALHPLMRGNMYGVAFHLPDEKEPDVWWTHVLFPTWRKRIRGALLSSHVSPNGESFALAIQDEGFSLFLNEESLVYHGPESDLLPQTVTWSPDGKQMAAVVYAHQERRYLLCSSSQVSNPSQYERASEVALDAQGALAGCLIQTPEGSHVFQGPFGSVGPFAYAWHLHRTPEGSLAFNAYDVDTHSILLATIPSAPSAP